MSPWEDALNTLDHRLTTSINYMSDLASGEIPLPVETAELCQDSLRELKEASAQIQAVRRECSASSNQAQYMQQANIKEIFNYADGLAALVLENQANAIQALSRPESAPALG